MVETGRPTTEIDGGSLGGCGVDRRGDRVPGLGARRAAALVVPALIPLLGALLASLRRVPFIEGDEALFELDVRWVTRIWPTTGAYSRFGFRHPGPAATYLVAPLYRAFGSDARALALAWTVLVGVIVGGGVWMLARRCGSRPALALIAGWLLALWILPADLTARPWNPYLVVPALVGSTAGAVAAWHGSRLGAWWALMAASIGVQAHVGGVPPLAITSTLAVAALWRGRRDRWMSRRGPVLAVGALVVLWLPVVIDLMFGSRNLIRLGAGSSQHAGLRGVVEVGVGVWSLDAWWLTGFPLISLGEGPWRVPVPWLLVVPLAAGIVLLALRRISGIPMRERTGMMPTLQVAGTAGLVLTLGLLPIVRFDRVLADYLVTWVPAAMCLVMAALVVAAVPERIRPESVVAGAALLAAGLVAWRAEEGGLHFHREAIGPATGAVAEEVLRLPDAADHTYVAGPNWESAGSLAAIVVAADRAGVHLRVAAELASAYRPEWISDRPPSRMVLVSASDPTSGVPPPLVAAEGRSRSDIGRFEMVRAGFGDRLWVVLHRR